MVLVSFCNIKNIFISTHLQTCGFHLFGLTLPFLPLIYSVNSHISIISSHQILENLINENLIKNIVENISGELDGKRVTRQGATQALSGEHIKFNLSHCHHHCCDKRVNANYM